MELKYLYPAKSEAIFARRVGLWLDGELRCNIVLANETSMELENLGQ